MGEPKRILWDSRNNVVAARWKATPSALAVSASGRRSHRYRGQHAADTAAAREPCMEEINVVGKSCWPMGVRVVQGAVRVEGQLPQPLGSSLAREPCMEEINVGGKSCWPMGVRVVQGEVSRAINDRPYNANPQFAQNTPAILKISIMYDLLSLI